MAARGKSYADVREQHRQGLARIQLEEEDGHFPYKAEQAQQALATPPDPSTNNHPEHWYTSEAIIEASRAMVAAQEAYLSDQGDATREAYEQAKRDLVEARRQHRQGRPPAPVAVAGPPADIDRRADMMRALAERGYNADAIAQLTGRPLTEVLGALAGRED